MKTLGISLLVAVAIGAPATASSGANIFGRCESEDVGRIANGSWYWFEMGRGARGWVHGGSYVTSIETINKSDYGRQSGYLRTTAYRLKRSDGTWVEKLYLPLSAASQICGY